MWELSEVFSSHHEVEALMPTSLYALTSPQQYYSDFGLAVVIRVYLFLNQHLLITFATSFLRRILYEHHL